MIVNASPTNGDELDSMIDAVANDPARAGEVKRALRKKLKAPGMIGHIERKPDATPKADLSDDPEDRWDNMPV